MKNKETPKSKGSRLSKANRNKGLNIYIRIEFFNIAVRA